MKTTVTGLVLIATLLGSPATGHAQVRASAALGVGPLFAGVSLAVGGGYTPGSIFVDAPLGLRHPHVYDEFGLGIYSEGRVTGGYGGVYGASCFVEDWDPYWDDLVYGYGCAPLLHRHHHHRSFRGGVAWSFGLSWVWPSSAFVYWVDPFVPPWRAYDPWGWYWDGYRDGYVSGWLDGTTAWWRPTRVVVVRGGATRVAVARPSPFAARLAAGFKEDPRARVATRTAKRRPSAAVPVRATNVQVQERGGRTAKPSRGATLPSGRIGAPRIAVGRRGAGSAPADGRTARPTLRPRASGTTRSDPAAAVKPRSGARSGAASPSPRVQGSAQGNVRGARGAPSGRIGVPSRARIRAPEKSSGQVRPEAPGAPSTRRAVPTRPSTGRTVPTRPSTRAAPQRPSTRKAVPTRPSTRVAPKRPATGRTVPTRPSTRATPQRPSTRKAVPTRPSTGRTVPTRPSTRAAPHRPSTRKAVPTRPSTRVAPKRPSTRKAVPTRPSTRAAPKRPPARPKVARPKIKRRGGGI